jgi:hypothetical protein
MNIAMFLGGSPPAPSAGTATFKSFNEANVATNGGLVGSVYTMTSTLNLAAGDFVYVVATGTTAPTSVTCGGVSMTAQDAWSYPNSTYYVRSFYILNTSANASAQIVATYDAAPTYQRMCAVQYSGIATSAAADGFDDNVEPDTLTDTSTNRTSRNITTTNANDLLIGFSLDWNFFKVVTAASGWTRRSASSGTSSLFGLVDKVVTQTGTYPSGTFSTTADTDQYMSFISAWKLA